MTDNYCFSVFFYSFQIFEWPVARPVEHNEEIRIQLLVHSKYFSKKVIGSYTLVLQAVVENGRLMVADSLVDSTFKPLPVRRLQYFLLPSFARSFSKNPQKPSKSSDSEIILVLDNSLGISNIHMGESVAI